MVLQKSNESTDISQWVFYRAARIGPAGENSAPLPDLKIALAFDQAGKIAKAIVTPFEEAEEGREKMPSGADRT